jgi:pyruvate/2-oxoglutarate dehydrogenase complex dihydrolipoamide acyltransferase (E2) component
MARIPIIIPQLGESIAEATIVRLNIAVGDEVSADQEIIEVETNKATMSVTTPCAGTVSALNGRVQHSYEVGAIIGWLEVDDAEAERRGLTSQTQPPADPTNGASESASAVPHDQPEIAGPPRPPAKVEPTVRGLPVPVSASGATYLSPRMKARMLELGLHAGDLSGLPGSGAGGRVTVDDFERFITELDAKRMSPASSMRVAVADAMRRSWTRPLATVGRPVCFDHLMRHRKNQEKKAGPALYALRALGLALGENSAPAGRLIGGQIIHPDTVDIGFAVEAEDGVLVPVIRNADKVPLDEMIERYNRYVDLARQRRLPPEATGGSVATITNFGSFGIVWATPIPLPEQTLVLGLGAGTRQPRWDDATQSFVPSLESEMTLSFDHRVLDGGGAGRLLARIAELLQTPELL